VTGVKVHVSEHPLITHKVTVLRDEKTPSSIFRELVSEIVTLLAYEATREIAIVPTTVQTPVAVAQGGLIAKPDPVVIPILRAGLGMLDGMIRLMPSVQVGFLGMVRDEKTLQASTYANRLPADLHDRQCFVLDPMLATGGTLIAAIHYLLELGASDINVICIISSPEGIAALEKEFAGSSAKLTVLTAALDTKLNEKGYIVPGLGDAGDRLYGVV
jgi:uracil phosphoribosyltransferase